MKVNKAIILAAGRGSRMGKLCNGKPKPLLKINGITLIESIILKLKESNIKKIYIVIGYLNEQFFYLKKKYKNLKLIINNNWYTGNNITSLKCVVKKLSNSLIINGDVIIEKNFLFNKSYDNSCTYAEINSNINEWSIQVNESNNITNFTKNDINHSGLYQREVTIVSKDLYKIIKKEINNYNIDEYYEILVLDCANKYNIKFTPYLVKKNSIFDIDNENDFIEYKKSVEGKL